MSELKATIDWERNYDNSAVSDNGKLDLSVAMHDELLARIAEMEAASSQLASDNADCMEAAQRANEAAALANKDNSRQAARIAELISECGVRANEASGLRTRIAELGVENEELRLDLADVLKKREQAEAELATAKEMLQMAARSIVKLRGAYMPVADVLAGLRTSAEAERSTP